MDFGIASVAGITVICYLVGLLVKLTPWDNNEVIPCVVGVVGAILGLVGYFLGLPDFPASEPITAAAVGIVSGLAATGVNQAVKQLSKGSGS